MTDRDRLIETTLAQTPWQDWQKTPLAGDASGRRYLRLSRGAQSVIVMDAPPENGEDTRPFCAIAGWLQRAGLAAPDILAHDPEAGVLVLSDLGHDDFAKWLCNHPADAKLLYRSATDVLVHLRDQPCDVALDRLTPAVASRMVAITGTYYARADLADLVASVRLHFERHAPHADTVALRDFHAENLIWRPDNTGFARVGLLDFQDAFLAPDGYDLASMLRDVRRDVDEGLAEDMTVYYMEKCRLGPAFRAQLACLGVQRNLRILGVFARLAKQRRKPGYIDLIPRVWANLHRDLEHPALAELRQAVQDCLPVPDHTLLMSLRK